MKTAISMVAYILLFCCSCYHNPPERNKIVFKNGDKAIQDSLLKMTSYYQNYPKEKIV